MFDVRSVLLSLYLLTYLLVGMLLVSAGLNGKVDLTNRLETPKNFETLHEIYHHSLDLDTINGHNYTDSKAKILANNMKKFEFDDNVVYDLPEFSTANNKQGDTISQASSKDKIDDQNIANSDDVYKDALIYKSISDPEVKNLSLVNSENQLQNIPIGDYTLEDIQKLSHHEKHQLAKNVFSDVHKVQADSHDPTSQKILQEALPKNPKFGSKRMNQNSESEKSEQKNITNTQYKHHSENDMRHTKVYLQHNDDFIKFHDYLQHDENGTAKKVRVKIRNKDGEVEYKYKFKISKMSNVFNSTG